MRALRFSAFAGALIASALAAHSTRAQEAADYPNRPVTIVAPSAAGGLFSLFARLIGGRLEQRLGQPFVVENRPGAGTSVGAVTTLRAPHDGYTLMVANSTTLAVNPALYKKLPYNAADFAPIALLARIPHVLVVHAGLPVHSIDDLVKLARSTPGGLSYGSAGPGTSQHLDAEMLKSVLDIPMTHVPYKGMVPALSDVAAGHIPMMFAVIPPALPLAQAGRIRMLGVTTRERIEPIPEVPPLAEIGVPGFDASTWFMLVAPAKTPRPIVDRLHRELREIMTDPSVRKNLVALGLMPVASPPPEELTGFVQAEAVRFGKVVTQAGLAGSQ
jgi:tripartite-type tricarboxylate transporter receptor subunit TctC